MADRDRYELRDRLRDRRLGRRRTGFGGLLIGTILAGVGVLLLLQNLGILYVEDLWQYWPAILIVLGISRAATACSQGGRIWGGTLAFIGAAFLLHNLGIIHGNLWRFFWPAILIFIGLGMLARSLERHNIGSSDGSPVSSDTVNTLREWAIFGGARRRIDSQEFEGGEALAIFGGVELDLHRAATKRDEIVIEANAMFGGIDMRVPDNWSVTVRGAGIFGGYEDKTDSGSAEGEKRPHLVISGYAVFGGVTVKN